MNDKRVKITILGIQHNNAQSGSYYLVLGEEDGQMRIPIIIGSAEAQSIALKTVGLEPMRPLNHDLFYNFARKLDADLKEVLIYKFEEGIFYSELTFIKGEEEIKLDSRTSDAVALSLRFNCPIYTYQSIIDRLGVSLRSDDDEDLDFEDDEIPNFDSPDYDDDEKELFSERKKHSHDGNLENKFDGLNLKDLEEFMQVAIDEENYEEAKDIKQEIERRKSKL